MPVRQVFISYTSANRAANNFAAHLANALERADIPYYIGWYNLKPGEEWQQQLRDAAKTSQVFVAVMSRAYTERLWPMIELDLALQAYQPGVSNILPVHYETLPTAESVKTYWDSRDGEIQAITSFEKDALSPPRFAENVDRVQHKLQAFIAGHYKTHDADIQLIESIVRRVTEVIGNEGPPRAIAETGATPRNYVLGWDLQVMYRNSDDNRDIYKMNFWAACTAGTIKEGYIKFDHPTFRGQGPKGYQMQHFTVGGYASAVVLRHTGVWGLVQITCTLIMSNGRGVKLGPCPYTLGSGRKHFQG